MQRQKSEITLSLRQKKSIQRYSCMDMGFQNERQKSLNPFSSLLFYVIKLYSIQRIDVFVVADANPEKSHHVVARYFRMLPWLNRLKSPIAIHVLLNSIMCCDLSQPSPTIYL